MEITKISTNYPLPLFVLVTVLLSISACKQSKERPQPDISHISVDVSVQRFEQALFQMDTAAIPAAYDQLTRSFPDFIHCYLDHIIGAKTDSAEERHTVIKELLTYGGFRAAYDSVEQKYPDIDWLRDDLTKAFQYSKHYLPPMPIPRVATFVSEYGFGAVMCSDSLMGIGLDLFLGPDFTFYPQLNFPAYLIRRMDRPYIVPSAMQVYAQSFVQPITQGGSLIDHMIYHGKLLYYLERVLPETPDSILIGYTEDELNWCRESEGEVWAYFLDKERLYENDRFKYNYLINEGSSTQGMPPESPGKIGRWVGWQIVRSYMNNNREVNMLQLFQEPRGQTILEASGYRPKR